MSSPLLDQLNAYILVTANGAPVMTGGRVTTTPGASYLLGCYLPRKQSGGTTTGADYMPIRTTPGDTLPGASGRAFLYGGYALQWAEAPDGYLAGDDVPDGLGWTDLSEGIPDWLVPGLKGSHMQGIEPPKHCVIESLTGKYGNVGIDEILIAEIGGVPLTVRSGELVD